MVVYLAADLSLHSFGNVQTVHWLTKVFPSLCLEAQHKKAFESTDLCWKKEKDEEEEKEKEKEKLCSIYDNRIWATRGST